MRFTERHWDIGYIVKLIEEWESSRDEQQDVDGEKISIDEVKELGGGISWFGWTLAMARPSFHI
jgi:hypothetical protein